MRQLVTLSLLQQQSASERLRGVDYAYRVDQSDTQVLAALLHAVNHDPNVNVRLAAVDALRKFAGSPAVRGTLDQSLVETGFADGAARADRFHRGHARQGRACRSLALERNPATDKNVKEKALWGLSQLQ